MERNNRASQNSQRVVELRKNKKKKYSRKRGPRTGPVYAYLNLFD